MAKHATGQTCISEYRNMVKSCSAPNCQNRKKKGCVTPFYCVPRNKDRKRRCLTFLCRKTLPNVEHMYVCGEHFVTGKYIICRKTFLHFPLLLENFLYNLKCLVINQTETVYFVVTIRERTLSMQEGGGRRVFVVVMKYFRNILMGHKIFSYVLFL